MLKSYHAKRDFSTTREPATGQPGEGNLRFVVQKHRARRLHYDVRLEIDGVLKSWPVPKGPSLDPDEKRLAVMVEDHPLDYGTYEGVIADGNYGAGEVIVWDAGSYSPDEDGRLSFGARQEANERMRVGLDAGKLSFTLKGRKLRGSWTLVKTSRGPNDWLLIKHRDGELLGSMSLANWQAVIDVNLTGTFLTFREALRTSMPSGGRLIAIASTASLQGGPSIAAYVSAKHGVLGLVRALAKEVAKEGITCNAVCPGFVDTDMAKGSGQFWVASKERAAKHIFRAIQRKKGIVYVTRRWWLIAKLLRLLPNRIYKTM